MYYGVYTALLHLKYMHVAIKFKKVSGLPSLHMHINFMASSVCPTSASRRKSVYSLARELSNYIIDMRAWNTRWAHCSRGPRGISASLSMVC